MEGRGRVVDSFVLVVTLFAQVSRQNCPCLLKLMMSQAVEGTWIRTGSYGRLHGQLLFPRR